MLRSLPANSDARIRLLAKFVEKDYEKTSLILAYRSLIADKWASSKKQTQTEWKQLLLEGKEARGGEDWLLDQLNERNFTLEVCWVSSPVQKNQCRKEPTDILLYPQCRSRTSS